MTSTCCWCRRRPRPGQTQEESAFGQSSWSGNEPATHWRQAGSGKFARTIAAAVPIATLPDPTFALHLSGLQPPLRPDKGARSGAPKMSKKPRKTRPRAAAKAALRKPRPTAAKRPETEHDTAERMVRALEAIATHLSAASPASVYAADLFDSADA